MRLGTKILLLTLAATVGLSGTVIWVVSHDVTAHEIQRARRTINDPDLAKALARQPWPQDEVLAANPSNSIRRYVWINHSLYLAMGVPIRINLGEEPSHAYFVGYRVDDQWLSKLLLLVRQD